MMAFNLEQRPLFQNFNVAKTLSDKQSLVSKYQTLIVTSGEEYVGPRRIYIFFKAFDEVCGQLGVFKELFLEMRKELVEAIFSDDIFPGITNDPSEIKRITHLEKVTKLFRERELKEQDCNSKVEEIERTLFEKQKSYEDLFLKFDQLTEKCNDRDLTISELKSEVSDLEQQKAILSKEFEIFRQSAEKERQEIKLDYQELQEELKAVRLERDLCKPFKVGFDRMQQEFQDIGLKSYEDIRAQETKPKALNQKEKLIADVKSAIKLQDQLLKGQNLLIQEYNEFLEKHKQHISTDTSTVSDDQVSSLSELQNRCIEAETADHQLIHLQKRFHENIERVDNEMNLLSKHQAMLEEQLLGMLQDSEGEKDSVLQLLKGISNAEDNGDEIYVQGNPFEVNDRVFSKYSLLLFVSTNGGKTFSELGGSKYCQQCFEKTSVCPHKLKGRELIIQLPKSASHLRLLRPEVKIDQQLLRKGLQDIKVADRKAPVPQISRRYRSHSSRASESTEMTVDSAKLCENDEHDGRFPNKFSQVWQDYHARTNVSRHHPITLPKALIESIIEQFYATCLWDDEYTPDEEEGYSTLDNFYEYLYSRYLSEDIVFLVAYDFFASLQIYADSDLHLQVFSHILCDNFDGSVFRYLLVLFDLINQIDWHHSEDFREFINNAYPFMEDDDIESFQIGFVAFCENKVSKFAVYNYILYTVLRYRDPYFLEMESKCVQSPMAEFGYLSEREFLSVAETVCDNSLDSVARRLFFEAAAAAERDVKTFGTVPVSKCSHILSYLSLLQIFATVKIEIREKIDNHRITQCITLRDESQRQEQTDLKWNYSSMLHLAKCMAKSEQFRQQVTGIE